MNIGRDQNGWYLELGPSFIDRLTDRAISAVLMCLLFVVLLPLAAYDWIMNSDW